MLPGPMSGRSMLPPWLSGVSELIESSSGDVLNVPMCGRYGSVTRSLQYTCSASTSTLRTRSGSGGFNVAVSAVPVERAELRDHGARPAGLSPRGAIDSMCTARASPFSAPVDHDRPVLRVHERHRQRRARQVGLGAGSPRRRRRASRRPRGRRAGSPGPASEYGPIVKWNVPWRSSVSSWVAPSRPPATPCRAMIESAGHPTGPTSTSSRVRPPATGRRRAPSSVVDGRWAAEPSGTAPYRTRVVVYRPVDPERFNGTVVLHWNNVTAGYDLFSGDTPEILDGGYAFAGVTTQRVGVHGLPVAPQGLQAWDPERYATLSITSDDDSFDIFTQAARAVGPDRDRTTDPLGGLDVERVIAMGSSQSAGRLATYVNAVHPLARAIDGFLLLIYFGSGTPLEVGDEVVNIVNPTEPFDARAALRGRNRIRDDLDVPVMVVNSELEAIACYPVRQPNTDRFRYWEAAGTCHVSQQAMDLRAPKYDARLRHAAADAAERQPHLDDPAVRRRPAPPAAVARDGHGAAGAAPHRVRRRPARGRPRRARHRPRRHPPPAGRGADRPEQRHPRGRRHLQRAVRLERPVPRREGP